MILVCAFAAPWACGSGTDRRVAGGDLSGGDQNGLAGDGGDASPADAGDGGDRLPTDARGGEGDGDGHLVGGDGGPRAFTAVTFNTGIHPTVGNGGFTVEQDGYLDTYYGHGLAWAPAIAAAQAFLDLVKPEIVAFQEIFDVAECAGIPEPARQGFICEGWTPGAPTVEELILGPGYQVACNFDASDKCAAVKLEFGSIRGCATAFCRSGLYGSRIDGCGSGGRIGRGVIDLVGGGTLNLVNVHGSSGGEEEDSRCRKKQVNQVFVDLGDGTPAANGAVNLVLGDFNTDPRNPGLALLDKGAERWNDFVGPDKSFVFVNEHVNSYQDVLCIDNVVSDALSGSCWYPGLTDGHAPVTSEGYFDHIPTVCTLTLP